MSLYQCDKCGCVDNTALDGNYLDFILKNVKQLLCSFCNTGKWHNRWDRLFLPKGEWFTNKQGNLENKKTHETDYKKYGSITEL